MLLECAGAWEWTATPADPSLLQAQETDADCHPVPRTGLQGPSCHMKMCRLGLRPHQGSNLLTVTACTPRT